MKSLRAVALLLFVLAAAVGLSSKAFAQADAIVGTWLVPDGDAKVQVYKCGDKYCGKIVWLNEPNDAKGAPITDKNNPNEKLRTRPVLNLVIMYGVSHKGGNEWGDGKVYDPESGNTYSGSIKLEDDKLHMRGYVGISLLGRTEVWTRVG